MTGMAEMEPAETGQDERRDSPGKAAPYKQHDKGLLLIGLFKLVEAVFFVSVGMGGGVSPLNGQSAKSFSSF